MQFKILGETATSFSVMILKFSTKRYPLWKQNRGLPEKPRPLKIRIQMNYLTHLKILQNNHFLILKYGTSRKSNEIKNQIYLRTGRTYWEHKNTLSVIQYFILSYHFWYDLSVFGTKSFVKLLPVITFFQSEELGKCFLQQETSFLYFIPRLTENSQWQQSNITNVVEGKLLIKIIILFSILNIKGGNTAIKLLPYCWRPTPKRT